MGRSVRVPSFLVVTGLIAFLHVAPFSFGHILSHSSHCTFLVDANLIASGGLIDFIDLYICMESVCFVLMSLANDSRGDGREEESIN